MIAESSNPSVDIDAYAKAILRRIGSEACELDRMVVWRGQADSSWKPLPGIYRRISNAGVSETLIDENLVSQFETDLLCESNGLGYYGEAGGNRLALMTRLQHHGGATRLLDVSRDPFVALWFATAPGPACNGELIRYSISPRRVAAPERVSTWDDLVNPDLVGMPLLYFPDHTDSRIVAQRAGFLSTVIQTSVSEGTVFTEPTEDHSIKRIEVPAEVKSRLRLYLSQSLGFEERTIYPDFDGYAKSNGANVPFARPLGKLYSGEYGLFPDRYVRS